MILETESQVLTRKLTFAEGGCLPACCPLALFSTPRFGVPCPHPQSAVRGRCPTRGWDCPRQAQALPTTGGLAGSQSTSASTIPRGLSGAYAGPLCDWCSFETRQRSVDLQPACSICGLQQVLLGASEEKLEAPGIEVRSCVVRPVHNSRAASARVVEAGRPACYDG